jgi:hypothetical protein
LRTASSNGEGLGSKGPGFHRKRTVMEETSAVDVLGQHYVHSGEQSLEWSKWDLVKRVICREKVLIQLESLILAQSERWRQA